MPKILQYFRDTVPQATKLPRVPAGGFAQPVAEGLEDLRKGFRELELRKRNVDTVNQYFSFLDEYDRGNDAIKENLRKEENTDNWMPIYEKESRALRENILKRRMYPEVRESLTASIGRSISTEQNNIRADALKRWHSKTLAGIDPKLDDFAIKTTTANTLVNRERIKAEAIGYIGAMESQGVIYPEMAEAKRNTFLRKIDLHEAQEALSADPGKFLEHWEENFKNLTFEDVNSLINEADKQLNAALEANEKENKDAILTELSMKASNRQISHRTLDELADETNLDKANYLSLRKILDNNLKVFKDQLVDELKAVGKEIDWSGEDKVNVDVNVNIATFEALREFDQRAKNVELTEDGEEYSELLYEMIEKYKPYIQGEVPIAIDQDFRENLTRGAFYPEGSIAPDKSGAFTGTTTTTTTMAAQEIIQGLKTGRLSLEEAERKALELKNANIR